LNFSNRGNCPAQSFIPRCFGKTTLRTNQRSKQPIRMFVLQVTLHALRTQHAVIDRKLFPRLEADHLVVLDLQLNAALHSAEAAMRLDQLRFAELLVLQPAAGKRSWSRR